MPIPTPQPAPRIQRKLLPLELMLQTKKMLQLNKRVESERDAMRLGASELRDKNKEKNKATLEFMGNPAVVAGVVIAVTGFGCFDGSWFVESCEHKIGSGYKTSVEIRKTLKY